MMTGAGIELLRFAAIKFPAPPCSSLFPAPAQASIEIRDAVEAVGHFSLRRTSSNVSYLSH
jgi:hypothetical protein